MPKSVKILKAYKGSFTLTAVDTENPLFEFSDITAAGWVRVTCVGDENVYFNWTCNDGVERLGFYKFS